MASGSQNGKSNNPKGKPKGSKTHKTLEWEALGDSIITIHAAKFNNILKNMDDEEFVDAYTKILGYFKPKLAAQSIDHTTKGEAIQTTIIDLGAGNETDK